MDDLIFFDYNRKSSVLLIFFFHAIIFSCLLLINGIKENKKDSKWLAAFIFLGGLYICPFMLGYAGWYSPKGYREFMFFVPFQQLFLIGPVFFFYTQTLLNIGFTLTRKDLVHFFLPIAYLVYSLIVFLSDKFILEEFYFYADEKDKDLDFWYQMSGLISMLFYLFKSLKHYTTYRKLSLQELSFADEIACKWIKNFTIIFGLILILRVLFFVINPEWGEFGSKFWYYLSFSVLLLYISITGYSATIRTSSSLKTPHLAELEPIENEEQKGSKHPLHSLSDLQEWKDQIIYLFEKDHIYKNPRLTVSDVAQLLNTNRNIISRVINQEFNMNFNDFVNKKRAEAVIAMLQKGEHTHITFFSIALDCGFNSKTTFNRAFKKHTGTTPKQFIAKNQL